MLRFRSGFHALFLGAAMLLGVLLTPANAFADKLHLKDGRVLEGAVSRELDGYVWFKFRIGGLESEQMFNPSEIVRIERDDKPAEPTAVTASEKPKAAPRAGKSGAPRAAVISLGEADKDMVGIYFTTDSMRRAIPMLKEEGVEIVVFRIRSGGGMGNEIQPMVDLIHNEYKKDFHVVAWIESAISAAAMTAHVIEDIYMMRNGSYGGCTGFRGGGEAIKGRELEVYLDKMEKISARGKHDWQIMRSMQIMEPLSCTIDEYGSVTWYNNLHGEHIVNPEGRVLTFNAADAAKYKFARGIADNIDELAKAMGYSEVQWVGKTVPGVPYPVSKAEEYMRNFRNRAHTDEKNTQRYFFEYNQAVALAAQTPIDERGKFVAKARNALDQIKRMVDNNRNFAPLTLGVEPDEFKDWVARREEELRRLMRR
jgi:hypothetical protein